VLLILFAVFGFPAILNLAATVSNFGRKNQNVIEKGVAPTIPRLAQSFDATSSAKVTLSGIADPKVTVEAFQDDNLLGNTVSGDDGKFNFDVTLSKGDNLFVFQATSDSGVKSKKTEVYKISYSNSPPKLEISGPKDGDKFKDSQISISGKTDPGVSVAVNDRLAITSSDGNFNYSLNLNSGDNKIRVVATDRAGNQTTKEITVKLE